MRRFITGILVLTLFSSIWLLGQDASPTTTKAKKAAPSIATQMKELKEQFDQKLQQMQQNMQQGMNQLQQQLQESNRQLQSAQQKIQATDEQLQAAQQAAIQAQAATNSLSTSVTELKVSTTQATEALAATKKDITVLQNPLDLRYKGVRIVPNGWFDLGMIVRTRNVNSDMATAYPAVPLNGTQNAGLSEFRLSARQTRFGFRAFGSPNPNVKLEGRFEMDMEADGMNISNDNQLSGYVPRLREAWGQAEFVNSGWVITGGQLWNLWTPNRYGTDDDRIFIPIGEDGAALVGHTYARRGLVRVAKKFQNKMTVAFEVENSATTVISAYTPIGILGIPAATNTVGGNYNLPIPCCGTNYSTGASTGAPTLSNGYSTNLMPDFLAKIAWDPGWGHYELRAIGSAFRDKVVLTSTGALYGGLGTQAPPPSVLAGSHKNTTYGGGVGWFSMMPFTHKFDFIYGASADAGNAAMNGGGNAEVTINNKYQLVPIKNLAGFAGFEYHPNKKWDIFAFYGQEYYQRSGKGGYVDTFGNKLGFGNSLVTSAPSNNKSMYDGQVGYWYRIYSGNYGAWVTGAELGYIERKLWPTSAAPAATGPLPLKGEDIVWNLAIRYVLP